MKNCLTRMLLIVWLVVLVGCTPGDRGQGTLSGHVTIGPLVPVMREGVPEPTPSPEVYAAWQIVVYTMNMRRVVARVDIDAAGDYRVELAPGTYLVTAEPVGGRGGPGGASTFEVVITRDEITRLDLDIDTGIR